MRQSYAERLTEIVGNLAEEEGVMAEEFQGLAKKIEGMFASYANGMLLKQSLENGLPKLDFVHVFDAYHSRYQSKDAILTNYLREVTHV